MSLRKSAFFYDYYYLLYSNFGIEKEYLILDEFSLNIQLRSKTFLKESSKPFKSITLNK